MNREITEIILNNECNLRMRIGKIEELTIQNPSEILIPLLILYLEPSTNWILQISALNALEKTLSVFPKKIQPLLSEILFEQEFHFYPKRAIGANILGRMKNTLAPPILIKLLQNTHENNLVRGACAEALAELQIQESIPVFEDILSNKFENYRVRAACALGLGWLQADQAVEILVENVWDENQRVWLAVIDSLHMFDSVSLNHTLFKYYLRAKRGTKRASALRELLVTRNILPLIKLVEKEHRMRLFEIIRQQGRKNFNTLQFLVEQMPESANKTYMVKLIHEIQPKVKISPELTLLL